jgi:hypothetical protein
MPTATNGRTLWRGRYVCPCVIESVPLVEARLKAAGVIKYSIDIYQYGYNAGGVAASAGTHDGGGVLDVAQYSDKALKIWRECGWAMWRRTPAQGFSYHGHGVLIGCPHASTGAKAQVTQYRNGQNGLANRGRDDGPNVPEITWREALDKYRLAAAIVIKADSTLPKGLLGMTSFKNVVRATDIPLTDGKWRTLPIDDKGNMSIVSGPTDAAVTVNLDVSGLKAGDVVQVRFVTADYRKGTPTLTNWQGPITEIIGTAGQAFGQVTFVGRVGDAPPKSRRLRVQAVAFSKGVKVTKLTTRALNS